MKRTKTIISTLVILLVVIFVVVYWNSGDTGKNGPELNVTQVIRFVAQKNSPPATQEGSCWASSIAAPYRTDAFRCTVGNEIHDPCFTTSDTNEVLCDVSPSDEAKGFVLKLTKPLPAPEVPPGETPPGWSWFFELGDGTFCTPFTGTRPFINGEAGFYGCTGSTEEQNVMIMGDLENTSPLWTAKKAIVVRDGMNWKVQSEDVVPVKIVWQ